MILLYLRILCFVLWIVTAVFLTPGLMRHFRGSIRVRDQYQTAFFFTALLFIGSLGRWLVIPSDTHLFTAIYAFMAALAIYVLILIGQTR